MITRKKLIGSGAALVGVPPSMQACAPTVIDPYDHHLLKRHLGDANWLIFQVCKVAGVTW